MSVCSQDLDVPVCDVVDRVEVGNRRSELDDNQPRRLLSRQSSQAVEGQYIDRQ